MKLFVLIAVPSFASAASALTPEEVEQYHAGAGMGYARAAELNHFPGPMLVLELAGPLGAKLVSAEQAVKQLFRSGW